MATASAVQISRGKKQKRTKGESNAAIADAKKVRVREGDGVLGKGKNEISEMPGSYGR